MKMTPPRKPTSHGRRIVTLSVAALLLVGCSEVFTELLGDEEDGGDTEVVEEPSDVGDTGSPEEDSDTVAEDPDEASPVAEAPDGPPRPDLGLPDVVLTTPRSGEGPRPLLTWEAVDGAATYAVTVYAGSGEPARWSWRGEGTSVRVGFVEDTTVGGPNIIDGMTWSVIALDGDDEPVAQSNERPLAP
jgi:hypothetical protein